jgi:hypothetical protein
MKTVLIILGAVILAGLIGFGGFEAGKEYQRKQQNQVQNDFLRSRGITGNELSGGNFPVGTPGANFGQGSPGGSGFVGSGMTGQVQSIGGNVVTISMARNTITVNLTDTTKIVVPAPTTLADLQVGQQVMVTGERDSSGNITATQILILGTTPTPTPGP